jgi:GNAT superfamily N-acetyltransferase
MHHNTSEEGPPPPAPQDNQSPQLAPFTDEADNAAQLTALFHRAYAEHAAQGRRFFGSYQSVEDTRRRVQKGECWVASVEGDYVGSVTVSGPGGFAEGYPASPQAGSFAQLAVDPAWRGTGLGSTLLALAEERLAVLGCTAIVIDTSSEAADLIGWYTHKGDKAVGTWRWDVTNYDSTVLRKLITTSDLGRY